MPRPREFDVNAALDRALHLFWSKGYEATSLDELCEVTDLSRSSFYAAFGSKRDLLLRSIDRYVEQRTPELAGILGERQPARKAFAALAELPRSDRAALARVRQGLARTEATFRGILMRAAMRGEFPPHADIDALARFLTAGFQGLRLVGKVNPHRTVLADIAHTMLRCLDSPPLKKSHRKMH
jgi:AcrR family transcriptional regulator